MEPLPQTPGLPSALPTARYVRHRPEATLLYELGDQHYPPFLAALEQDGRTLPTFVQQEFAAYLKCGRLEHGFLRVRCTQCHAERLVAFSVGESVVQHLEHVHGIEPTGRFPRSQPMRTRVCRLDLAPGVH